MMKNIFLLLGAFMGAGCTAIDPDVETFDLSRESVVFMTVSTENRVVPSYGI